LDHHLFWSEAYDNHLAQNLPELTALGMRVAQFPASEALCERVFCNLRLLISDYRVSMNGDLADWLMTLKMASILGKQSYDLSKFNNVVDEQLKKYSHTPTFSHGLKIKIHEKEEDDI
jgi:hypothetical protein